MTRTRAEWVTFGVSCAIVVGLMSVIVAEALEPARPPDPVVSIVAIEEFGSRHHVSVEVLNMGNRTAADVQVSAELVIDGEPTEAHQTIAFLAGSERTDLVFVFVEDPSMGDLAVLVTGFATP